MATIFEPPPTYADPVLYNERTGKSQFNPIWLNWFLRFAATLQALGGGSVALAAPGGNGLIVHVGSGVTEARQIAGSAYVDVAEPSGVGGNPTVSINEASLREWIQDWLATSFVAGANVTIIYNDTLGTFTFASSGGGGGGGSGSIDDAAALQAFL